MENGISNHLLLLGGWGFVQFVSLVVITVDFDCEIQLRMECDMSFARSSKCFREYSN